MHDPENITAMINLAVAAENGLRDGAPAEQFSGLKIAC
jgi:hypothetical protein